MFTVVLLPLWFPLALINGIPYGNLQPLPGVVDDRYRAISLLRLAKGLNGGPIERVKRIPNANHYVFRSNEADVIREVNAFISTLPDK
jgi:hypothetical protein